MRLDVKPIGNDLKTAWDNARKGMANPRTVRQHLAEAHAQGQNPSELFARHGVFTSVDESPSWERGTLVEAGGLEMVPFLPDVELTSEDLDRLRSPQSEDRAWAAGFLRHEFDRALLRIRNSEGMVQNRTECTARAILGALGRLTEATGDVTTRFEVELMKRSLDVELFFSVDIHDLADGNTGEPWYRRLDALFDEQFVHLAHTPEASDVIARLQDNPWMACDAADILGVRNDEELVMLADEMNATAADLELPLAWQRWWVRQVGRENYDKAFGIATLCIGLEDLRLFEPSMELMQALAREKPMQHAEMSQKSALLEMARGKNPDDPTVERWLERFLVERLQYAAGALGTVDVVRWNEWWQSILEPTDVDLNDDPVHLVSAVNSYLTGADRAEEHSVVVASVMDNLWSTTRDTRLDGFEIVSGVVQRSDLHPHERRARQDLAARICRHFFDPERAIELADASPSSVVHLDDILRVASPELALSENEQFPTTLIDALRHANARHPGHAAATVMLAARLESPEQATEALGICETALAVSEQSRADSFRLHLEAMNAAGRCGAVDAAREHLRALEDFPLARDRVVSEWQNVIEATDPDVQRVVAELERRDAPDVSPAPLTRVDWSKVEPKPIGDLTVTPDNPVLPPGPELGNGGLGPLA
jgi:hypothetical protein